jgi:predicted transcriptional regulator
MSTSTKHTVEISAATQERLTELAEKTRRPSDVLANEALAAYVQQELDIIAGIEEGLADIAAGRVTPHEEVDAEIRALIAAAK